MKSNPLKDKKLTQEEIDRLGYKERLDLCKCLFGFPQPSYVHPDCPLHWKLMEKKPC